MTNTTQTPDAAPATRKARAHGKALITVTTPVGTFTRTTGRTYTHVVVAKDERAEWLEARRVQGLADARGYLARHERTLATGRDSDERPGTRDREFTITALADGSVAKWIAHYREEIVRLDVAPIVADKVTGWLVLGWSGRLDLARKAATSRLANIHRDVRIFDLATGAEVR